MTLDVSSTPTVASGVIWITGFSGAGKTSVARHVEGLLRQRGEQVIFLDGDDLRSIFAARWGYERADRVELASVYFRLCSHLASQGFLVVIAAVAMYDEVRSWVRANVPRSMEVLLDVPLDVRVARDEGTKGVYRSVHNMDEMYEPPTDPDLRLANFGDMTTADAARAIVSAFVDIDDQEEPDRGKSRHWDSYYGTTVGSLGPSPFVLAAEQQISGTADILEVGCGNGRDAAYLSSRGHRVVALDASSAAVELCGKVHDGTDTEFLAGVVSDFSAMWARRFDVLYSRFVIHAMTEPEELALLREARDVLRPSGLLLVECRSINDPLAREGEVLSPTERISGHYRRFIVMEEFCRRLGDAGFVVESAIESSGLARHGDEDPVVIRVNARNG